MSDDSSDSPIIKFGDPGYYEDWLVGNRSGFLALRDAVDDVIKEGGDTSLNFDCEFAGLKMTDCHPGSSDTEDDSSYLGVIGCCIAIFAIVGVFILGIWKLIELATS